ncbi:hypothetical protein PoB_003951200 [Plakobranchus ocellatus]|uniref:Uncharacterized protein n=1 Tax=Plakobranchus ocellatus TaxID=259542 RepID=A0AAV4B1N1_9GAST|nr:hypothetical protein PoB_003951200 [Plakobranchus ocellatus]
MKTALIVCILLVITLAAFVNAYPECLTVGKDENFLRSHCKSKRYSRDYYTRIWYCCEDLSRRPMRRWEAHNGKWVQVCGCVTRAQELVNNDTWLMRELFIHSSVSATRKLAVTECRPDGTEPDQDRIDQSMFFNSEKKISLD